MKLINPDYGHWRYGQRASLTSVSLLLPPCPNEQVLTGTAVQYTPKWITGIGIFFCLLNMVLFLTNCVMLTARFCLRPGSFTQSFTDQVESLFIPAFVSSSFSTQDASRLPGSFD